MENGTVKLSSVYNHTVTFHPRTRFINIIFEWPNVKSQQVNIYYCHTSHMLLWPWRESVGLWYINIGWKLDICRILYLNYIDCCALSCLFYFCHIKSSLSINLVWHSSAPAYLLYSLMYSTISSAARLAYSINILSLACQPELIILEFVVYFRYNCMMVHQWQLKHAGHSVMECIGDLGLWMGPIDVMGMSCFRLSSTTTI